MSTYYAIAKGRVPGIYTSWPQAKAQVDGFKYPKYRKFPTREEAAEFVQRYGASEGAKEIVSVVTTKSDVEHDRDALVVFTDGSAIGNGSRSARAGYAMVWPNHPHLTCGKPLEGEGKTNNRAEFMACIDALEVVDTVDPNRNKQLHIYTDSMLLINTVTKWMKGWKRNGWRKASGDPILNRDLVERLDVLLSSTPRKVTWQHVEAHTSKQDWVSTWNAKADELAKKSAR